MISKLKVTDGDLLIPNMNRDVTHEHMNTVKNRIQAWLRGKGLNNVELLVSCGDDLQISRFTINDVFEDEVVK